MTAQRHNRVKPRVGASERPPSPNGRNGGPGAGGPPLPNGRNGGPAPAGHRYQTVETVALARAGHRYQTAETVAPAIRSTKPANVRQRPPNAATWRIAPHRNGAILN